MKLTKIIDSLEKWAPPIYQESYDNSGLLIGNKKNEIKGCLISLDCTEKVIDEALKKGCKFVWATTANSNIVDKVKKLNYKVLDKKLEVLEIDDTPAYGLETVLKIGINGVIECI